MVILTEELRANRGQKLMELLLGEPFKLVFDATAVSHLNVRQLVIQARETALETPYLCATGLRMSLVNKHSRTRERLAGCFKMCACVCTQKACVGAPPQSWGWRSGFSARLSPPSSRWSCLRNRVSTAPEERVDLVLEPWLLAYRRHST